MLQEGFKDFKLLHFVVEITVENEVIADLPEPIRMDFPHDVIPVSLSCFDHHCQQDQYSLQKYSC